VLNLEGDDYSDKGKKREDGAKNFVCLANGDVAFFFFEIAQRGV